LLEIFGRLHRSAPNSKAFRFSPCNLRTRQTQRRCEKINNPEAKTSCLRQQRPLESGSGTAEDCVSGDGSATVRAAAPLPADHTS
jgi:hypothetical protein